MLAEAGLAPRILHADRDGYCLERCDPFADWWRAASRTDLDAMATRVVNLIAAVHTHGVCHRDLHDGNVLLRGGQPLVIDLEWAVEVDPAWPCYDLYGPNEHVPVLPYHAAHNGIWWDVDLTGVGSKYRAMGEIFGPLSEVRNADIPFGLSPQQGGSECT